MKRTTTPLPGTIESSVDRLARELSRNGVLGELRSALTTAYLEGYAEGVRRSPVPASPGRPVHRRPVTRRDVEMGSPGTSRARSRAHD